MTDEKQPDAPAQPQVSPVENLLRQALERIEDISGVVIGVIDKKGKAVVRWSPMPPHHVAHLARVLDVKLDREYANLMYPPAAAPVREAPLSRHERRRLESIARRAGKKPRRTKR